MKFGKLLIGDVFSLFKDSKLTYRKTAKDEAVTTDPVHRFGLLLGEDFEVSEKKKSKQNNRKWNSKE